MRITVPVRSDVERAGLSDTGVQLFAVAGLHIDQTVMFELTQDVVHGGAQGAVSDGVSDMRVDILPGHGTTTDQPHDFGREGIENMRRSGQLGVAGEIGAELRDRCAAHVLHYSGSGVLTLSAPEPSAV